MGMVKHSRSSQKSKFAMSLEKVNAIKKVRAEADFFDAEKRQSFLTVDFNSFGTKVLYNVMGMVMKT